MDLSVLAADLAQQRRQFLIRRLIARLVQVQSVDGLHQLPGYPGRQHQRQHKGQHQHQGHRLHSLDHQAPDGVLRVGHPQNRTVREAQGVIDGLFRQRVGAADRMALPQHRRLMDLLPVGVIFHLGRVLSVIIKHRAVRVHQRDAAAAGKILVQIVDSLVFNAMGDVRSANRQIRQDAVLKIPVKHAHNQQ